jgi:hypothetical protein
MCSESYQYGWGKLRPVLKTTKGVLPEPSCASSRRRTSALPAETLKDGPWYPVANTFELVEKLALHGANNPARCCFEMNRSGFSLYMRKLFVFLTRA